MNITGKVNYEDYAEDDDAYTFQLTFESACMSVSTDIYEPYSIPPKKFEEFISCLESRKESHLNFYCGNGDGSMSIRDGHLSITTGLSGARGDITTIVRIPLDQYGNTLASAFRGMINEPGVQAIWPRYSATRR